jgi:RNA polymerase primary sigma factor
MASGSNRDQRTAYHRTNKLAELSQNSGYSMRTELHEDSALVARLLAGDADAAKIFLQRLDERISATCRALATDERCFRDFYELTLAAIQQDSFNCLRSYDGKNPLTTFVVLTVHAIVRRHLPQLIRRHSIRGWTAFEKCFGPAIKKQVARRIRTIERREDAYQEVCMALIERNFMRLRSYRGGGTFSAFVFRTVENLLVDLERAEQGRRRPPAAIEKLCPLDRLVFRALYWARTPADPARLRSELPWRAVRDLTDLEIEQSVRRVRDAMPRNYLPCGIVTIGLAQIDSEGQDANALRQRATAEDDLIERENAKALAQVTAQMQAEISKLSVEGQLCLRLVMQGHKPREIAKQLGRSVDGVYRILRQARGLLLVRLQGGPSVSSKASVASRRKRLSMRRPLQRGRGGTASAVSHAPTEVSDRHADA